MAPRRGDALATSLSAEAAVTVDISSERRESVCVMAACDESLG